MSSIKILPISNAKALGTIIKHVRKASKLTQAQLAAASGVGERFVREVEKGKPSCQLEKTLHLVAMLGMQLKVHITSEFDRPDEHE